MRDYSFLWGIVWCVILIAKNRVFLKRAWEQYVFLFFDFDILGNFSTFFGDFFHFQKRLEDPNHLCSLFYCSLSLFCLFIWEIYGFMWWFKRKDARAGLSSGSGWKLVNKCDDGDVLKEGRLWRFVKEIGGQGWFVTLGKSLKGNFNCWIFFKIFHDYSNRQPWILIKLYFWKMKLILGGMIWCVCGWIQMYIFVCFQNDIKDKNSNAADF